jgi:hypothetical protein
LAIQLADDQRLGEVLGAKGHLQLTALRLNRTLPVVVVVPAGAREQRQPDQ